MIDYDDDDDGDDDDEDNVDDDDDGSQADRRTSPDYRPRELGSASELLLTEPVFIAEAARRSSLVILPPELGTPYRIVQGLD